MTRVELNEILKRDRVEIATLAPGMPFLSPSSERVGVLLEFQDRNQPDACAIVEFENPDGTFEECDLSPHVMVIPMPEEIPEGIRREMEAA